MILCGEENGTTRSGTSYLVNLTNSLADTSINAEQIETVNLITNCGAVEINIKDVPFGQQILCQGPQIRCQRKAGSLRKYACAAEVINN